MQYVAIHVKTRRCGAVTLRRYLRTRSCKWRCLRLWRRSRTACTAADFDFDFGFGSSFSFSLDEQNCSSASCSIETGVVNAGVQLLIRATILFVFDNHDPTITPPPPPPFAYVLEQDIKGEVTVFVSVGTHNFSDNDEQDWSPKGTTLLFERRIR